MLQPARALTLAAVAALALPAAAQVPDLYDPDVFREVRLTFKQAGWWQLLRQNKASKTDIEADMLVDGKTYPRVGARFRGQTSYSWLPPGSEKIGFNISMDAFVRSQDLYGYDNLNFNNGFHDPTFMREFVAYALMRRYGPAPKVNFIKLYLNDRYWGVYINVQQPNKDMMKEWFRSNDGNRYRGFPRIGSFRNGRCALTWLGNNVQAYRDAYEVKQGDATDLMQVCNVLNNTPQSQLQAALPRVFSVDQFYRYASVMNIILQTDSYIGSGKDHFLYQDEVYGAFHMFPFDLNESFGAEGGGNPRLSPWFNSTSPFAPALSKTLVFADWRARYVAHYRTILEESFSWQEIGAMVTKYQNLIRADVVRDTKKIYTTAQFTQNVTQSVFGPGGPRGRNVNIPGLQPIVTQRQAYLTGLPELNTPRPTLADLQHSPARPTSNDSVCVTVRAQNAAAVKLWRRSAGPFAATAMFDDGNHCDQQANDGIWGVVLPASPPGTIVDYYVEATTAAGVARYLPKTAEHRSAFYRIDWPTGSSPIKLNEFVARNVNGIVDQNNQREDWLELHNTANQTVTVGGMYLTDDLSQSTKWQIPAGQTIPAGGTLLIWCDEDANQGPLHASFKLSASGEEIALFATDGKTLLDTLTFGPQQADVATGRLFDGKAPWVTFSAPTPRARNEQAACGTRAFSALDSTAHVMSLALNGAPKIGTSPTMAIAGGPPSTAASLFLSAAGSRVELPFASVTLMLDVTGLVGPISLPLDSRGALSAPLAIPNDPTAPGRTVAMQVFALAPAGLAASNAVEILFCR